MKHRPEDPPLAAHRTDALVALELPAEPEPLDLRTLFGNDHPVELEVGVGKGLFVMLAAHARPEVNFLGLEYARRPYELAVDRSAKRALTNVRLALSDAVDVVEKRLPDASISACHVYFPDPWPKSRHHKRRFVRDAVVAQLARVMQPGALLRVITDHPGYALWIAETMERATALFVDRGTDLSVWEVAGLDVRGTSGWTNFEVKYRREGRPIHRFAWARR